MKTKTPLRQAFISTIAGVAAVTAVGCLTVTTAEPNGNPAGCPAFEPSGGACSDPGLACEYEDGCGSPIEYTCAGDTWQITQQQSCNPPPPAECPLSMPAYGESCFEEGMVCSYGTDGCGFEMTATCIDFAWQTDEGGSCNPPPAECPADLPELGTECEMQPDTIDSVPGWCAYTIATPCGPDDINVGCAYDAMSGKYRWGVNEAPTCTVPASSCSGWGNATGCDVDPNCTWLVPGCDEGLAPSIEVAGCYASDSCAANDCASWGTCEVVTHNPCWNQDCDSCGGESEVCVPSP